MSAAQSKELPAAHEALPKGDGFGTPGQAVPAKTQKAAKRKTRIPPPPNDPARGLFADAMEEACRLKRKHRALFNANPKEFRQQVKKAASRVFRLKPGPKQDAKIAAAARERARGAAWEQLYAEHIDHYTGMPEFTRDLAEAGFKRKVNAYLHKPPQASLAQTQILPEDQGQQMIAPITRS